MMDQWKEKFFEALLEKTISYPGSHIQFIEHLLENGYAYSAWSKSFIGNFFFKAYLIDDHNEKRAWLVRDSRGSYFIEFCVFHGKWNTGSRMIAYSTLKREDVEWFLCRMMQGALQ